MIEFEKSDAAIITVRALSTRLKKKCFQKLFENKSMIEIVIERAKKIGCDLILATSSSIEDDELEEIAKKHQIYCFRGSLKNKIHRWYNCFNEFFDDKYSERRICASFHRRLRKCLTNVC